MTGQNCYLCGSNSSHKRKGEVRDDASLTILECNECGLVYLSNIHHIRESHYEESGMHGEEKPDITSWLKDTQIDDQRRYSLLKQKMVNKSVLDFGCGIGGFIEIAQHTAKSVAGVELEKALTTSFSERNLKVYTNHYESIEEGKKWDMITAFHVVEHLTDPKQVLQELSTLLTDGGELIIEVPNSNDVLLTLYENEAFQKFTYWSQHLYLFNAHTLGELVKQAGLKLKWVDHIQRYPLSNHLHWLAKDKPGGHQKWNFLNDGQLNDAYSSRLASLGMTDTIIAGIEIDE